MKSPVGTSVPRVDGRAKVTGAALYVDDITFDDALYGCTLRSRVPHGTLESITPDPDFDWTDITVVTAADIPGANVVTLMVDDQPALVPVGGRIMHPDEPLALVAAPTRRRARAALEHLRVEVSELPAVFDVEASINKAINKEVLLYGDDNIFKSFTIHKGGDVEAELKQCDLVIEGTYRTGAQEQMYIEPNGVVAWFDENGACHVTGSLQCPYYVHTALKPLLGLEDEQVIVSQAVTGGGFGGKEEYPSMLACHASLLAKKSGRTVKVVYDRDEDIGATTKRHPGIVRHRLGVMKDGTLHAVAADITFDGGAYLTLSPVVLSRGILHAAGPYKVPHVHLVGRAVATNTPPHGAFRGFGAPQTTFVYERQLHKAARALGVDAFALRRQNMLKLGDVTATGQELKYSVGSESVLAEVEDAAAGPGPVQAPGPEGEHIKRGRGLAFYFHGAGFTGSGEDRLKGQVTAAVGEGGRFEVRSASTDIGQGAITIFSQIAAEVFGVPAADIHVLEARTDMVPNSGPTVASRTAMVVGAVVGAAARMVRERLIGWADERGIDASDLAALAEVYFKEEGGMAETATYASPAGVKWDDATYTGDAYPVYGWAACLVEVAVDVDTYEVTVERCIHAVDVGKAINPVIVKGQIEGGTLQALGWALWESVDYEGGRVVNRRMTDNIIPTSIEAPEMETLVVEEPYPHGPGGAKGVGEIPMDGPAAAVANALEDALGVPFDELPILPEAIERALREGPA